MLLRLKGTGKRLPSSGHYASVSGRLPRRTRQHQSPDTSEQKELVKIPQRSGFVASWLLPATAERCCSVARCPDRYHHRGNHRTGPDCVPGPSPARAAARLPKAARMAEYLILPQHTPTFDLASCLCGLAALPRNRTIKTLTVIGRLPIREKN